MKAVRISFLFILFLPACYSISDDTDLECFTDCSTIKGRFINSVDQPVPNIPLQFISKDQGELHNLTRIISETTTDLNGFFEMNFLLEDEEVGTPNADRWLKLRSDLDLFSSENYFVPADHNEDGFWDLQSYFHIPRDSLMVFNYYLTEKGSITVRLDNFTPVLNSDYFKVDFKISLGKVVQDGDVLSPEIPFHGLASSMEATEQSTFNPNVSVAVNDSTKLVVSKKKNGQVQIEEFFIYITEDNINEPIVLYY